MEIIPDDAGCEGEGRLSGEERCEVCSSDRREPDDLLVCKEDGNGGTKAFTELPDLLPRHGTGGFIDGLCYMFIQRQGDMIAYHRAGCSFHGEPYIFGGNVDHNVISIVALGQTSLILPILSFVMFVIVILLDIKILEKVEI